jgi:hypothetical protein
LAEKLANFAAKIFVFVGRENFSVQNLGREEKA